MRFVDLENADTALLGAGREGQSVWRQFRRRFPDQRLTVYSESPVDKAFAGEMENERGALVVGPFADARLEGHDVLVRSPGVSPYRESLSRAREAGVRFTTASNLWFGEHPGARTICITGTKGKSTTSALTAHLLAKAGHRVRLAGNIGQPLLDCPDSEVDWWVIELSSYQLADLEGRPTIGVLLNLSDAHLEWHGGRDAYRRDKLRLVDLAQRSLIVNYGDETLREMLGGRGGVTWFDGEGGFRVRDGVLLDPAGAEIVTTMAALPGRHNLLNLAAALAALGAAGVEMPDVREALADFSSLPHRLQLLGTREGLAFYNDSLATTPVATLAALEALRGKPITLILGGQRQHADWGEALARMRGTAVHAIIAIPDSGPELARLVQDAGIRPAAGIHTVDSLADAVALAFEISAAGCTVLLSPGAPSFPQFRDFADRGSRFADLAGLAQDGNSERR